MQSWITRTELTSSSSREARPALLTWRIALFATVWVGTSRRLFPFPRLGPSYFADSPTSRLSEQTIPDGAAHEFHGTVFAISTCATPSFLVKRTRRSATPGCRSDSTF